MIEPTAIDAGVIVAALLTWHEDHGPAYEAVRDLLEHGSPLVVPAPALVEAYAVMTRLPVPHRLPPAAAIELLAANFRDRAHVVSLQGAEVWDLLESVGSAGATGGLAYDAQLLACARKIGARRLLTFDRRAFARLDTAGIALVDPRELGSR